MIEIHEGYDLTKMTTFGLRVECGRLIEYDNAADLKKLYTNGMLDNALPIGGGSNLLFLTPQYNGTVIHNRSQHVEFEVQADETTVICKADAGVTLDNLCRQTASAGLWGLENLSGIPGEIGGAAVQNVGAYGAEFKDVALRLHCFDTQAGAMRTIEANECRYGYRDSMFKHLSQPNSLIVVDAELQLSQIPNPNLSYAALNKRFDTSEHLVPLQLRDAVIELRDSKLPNPAKIGSAGSFFKNPVVSKKLYEKIQKKVNKQIPIHVLPTGEVKLTAAWLIDNAGCKPLTSGGAALWQSQPLVIVNSTGNATGGDVLNLEHEIIARVYDTFGVTLQPEVIHISNPTCN